jgi:hypothetical protein
VRFASRVDRVLRGGQRLTQHLTTEHELRADVATLAAKQVVFQPFEVQQVDQFGDVIFQHGGNSWRVKYGNYSGSGLLTFDERAEP